MGFRIRKSFKIFKGFRINLSKSGLSSTIGGKGFSVNIGKRGGFLNTSIPGTWLSRRDRIFGGSKKKSNNYNKKYIRNNNTYSYNSNTPTHNVIKNNNYNNNETPKKKDKERAIALCCLSITCLPFGLHKFYLGNKKAGVIYSVFFWSFIPQIISLIELILLVRMDIEKFDNKYNSYFVEKEKREALYNKVFNECKNIQYISADLSLTKDELCLMKSNNSKWYEYRKIKGNDSLELIYEGVFYLTTKKIIFVSKSESKQIDLKDIILEEIQCNLEDMNLPNILGISKTKGRNVIFEFLDLEDMFKTYFLLIGLKNNLLKITKGIEE